MSSFIFDVERKAHTLSFALSSTQYIFICQQRAWNRKFTALFKNGELMGIIRLNAQIKTRHVVYSKKELVLIWLFAITTFPLKAHTEIIQLFICRFMDFNIASSVLLAITMNLHLNFPVISSQSKVFTVYRT